MKFFEQDKKKALTFSFDDGVAQDIRMIELMNKYGLKGTFNLNSLYLSNKGIMNVNGMRICHYKVAREDVRDVYAGHEIAVHTLTHPKLTECETDEIIRQVEQDRLNLSELAGYEVVGMAYPGGGVNNDDRVAQIVKEHTGVKYSRTTTCTGGFAPQDNLYRYNPTAYYTQFDALYSMGERFLKMKPDTPQVFYIWGHTYDMDIENDYWVKVEEFFKFISNRDDIFYGTNKEVLLK